MSLLAGIGFLMVLVLVFCLISKRLLPPVAFILLPVIAALLAGFGITEIGDYATDGIKSMVSTVSLFVFSISFFSLMGDVGVFDAIVNKLTKIAGNNITAVMLATAAIAIIAHLDGSGATTFIITITAMGPIYTRMRLDKRNLMLISCMALGVMNILPWAGPTMRAASVLEMEASKLWHPLIPMMDLLPAAFTFMIGLALGLVINIRDQKVQNKQLRQYGTAAMTMVVTLFAAGVFTGVLKGTGMLDHMASAIVTVIPPALGPYTHLVIAVLSVPLIMCLGTDSFYYGLLPVVIGVCGNFGIAGEIVTRVLVIAENIGVTVSPLTPSVYLALGLLDLDIGEHIKYALPWIWGFSILSVVLSIIIGVVPL